jgi:hypothetical protein
MADPTQERRVIHRTGLPFHIPQDDTNGAEGSPADGDLSHIGGASPSYTAKWTPNPARTRVGLLRNVSGRWSAPLRTVIGAPRCPSSRSNPVLTGTARRWPGARPAGGHRSPVCADHARWPTIAAVDHARLPRSGGRPRGIGSCCAPLADAQVVLPVATAQPLLSRCFGTALGG